MNYWKYRAGNVNPSGNGGEELYYNWTKDLHQGVINQKQERIGDIRNYKTKNDVKAMRPDHPGRAANAWAICNEMEVGDIVFSIGHGDEILGVGTVTGAYFYDDTDGMRFHKRPVKWMEEKHCAKHGLQQGSLSKFNLKNPETRNTLSHLLELFGMEECI